MGEKFSIGRNKNSIKVVDLDTGQEVHAPEIAAAFMDTVDRSIHAAGGKVVELPEEDQRHLSSVEDEGAEIIQLFPDLDQDA